MLIFQGVTVVAYGGPRTTHQVWLGFLSRLGVRPPAAPGAELPMIRCLDVPGPG